MAGFSCAHESTQLWVLLDSLFCPSQDCFTHGSCEVCHQYWGGAWALWNPCVDWFKAIQFAVQAYCGMLLLNKAVYSFDYGEWDVGFMECVYEVWCQRSQ